MSMRVAFPGGKRVDALYKGFTIRTDQPVEAGGENSAPSPFDLFLASLGTCAGFYVLAFCERRGLPAAAITLTLDALRGPDGHGVAQVDIRICLPDEFPAEYVNACILAAEQCAVKRHLQVAPRVEVTAERNGATARGA